MNEQLTLSRIAETFDFLKRQTAPFAAALVSPQLKQQLEDAFVEKSISTSLGVFKVFVSSKCPHDCFYAGTEAQILEMLHRLEAE